MDPVIDHRTHEVRYDGILGRCNSIEGRYMRAGLGLTHDQIREVMLSPVGPVIVGQDPGENTSDALPMFPWPENSAGGRLLRYSAMSAFDYLRTFHRVNLMASHQGSWRVAEARAAAVRLLARYDGHPLILLGTRVRDAFSIGAEAETLNERARMRDGNWVMVAPHPSGRNLAYNTPAARAETRLRLWLAVDLWRHPAGPSARVGCHQCDRLAQAHPAHAGDPGFHVLCPGTDHRIVRPLHVF